MNNTFLIQHDWLHTEQISQAERATQAEISILVNGTCVTVNEDRLEGTTRQSARLSALHLSEWIATNWWRLLWEPDDGRSTPEWQMYHNISAAGGGYVWPDLSFSSDWNTVLVHSSPTQPLAAEPVHYSRSFNLFISVASFERGIDNFVSSTLDRLSRTAKKHTDLAELWNMVLKERTDPQIAEWRMLEACLGYDPDEAPSDFLEHLHDQNDLYGTGAVQELAAASKNNAITHLQTLGDEIKKRGIPVQVSQYNEIQKRLAVQRDQSNNPTWQRGAQAAKVARSVWNLPDGPISNHTLSGIFGFDMSESYPGESDSKPTLPLSGGMRDDSSEGEFRVSFNQRHLTGRRFTLARLVADHLETQQNEILLPATRAKTSRQKFQRAFAQEFLCPLDQLRDFLETAFFSDDDINDAAAYFQVSPLTIKTTLVNKGILEREKIFGDWDA